MVVYAVQVQAPQLALWPRDRCEAGGEQTEHVYGHRQQEVNNALQYESQLVLEEVGHVFT